jgi:PAS domain S-box-containing protein
VGERKAPALAEDAAAGAPGTDMSALEYARSIVDTVREPLLVLDSSLYVRTASRSFYSTFGVNREETEGRFVYDLGNGQWNIPALRTLLEEVLTMDKAFEEYEVVHRFPVLGERVMLLNARKLWTEADETSLILLAIEDVTERKRIADELVRSNEELQRFAYVAAHDLRSPLNSALNLCQLLAQRVKTKFNEKEREILGTAIESIERLSKLMNDLLEYSETGNVPQHRVLVSLGDPLRVSLANLQHHIDASGATITVRELPTVEIDRTQTALLFQNLIGNAIKYRREDTPLRVHIEAVQEGTDCRVSVTDNGQGFKAEHAVYIFEPFRRLHGAEIKGSGIGLATCKRIVERWGGRIWAESIPGEGSTFFFTIPGDNQAPGSSSTSV